MFVVYIDCGLSLDSRLADQVLKLVTSEKQSFRHCHYQRMYQVTRYEICYIPLNKLHWLKCREYVTLQIQLWTFANVQLLNKPYENEVTLTGQNPPSKCCQHLET